MLVIAADGDSHGRRVLFLAAREVFPNVLLCIRDSAHALRIAAKALHTDDVFGEVWHELFDARHALVPDLMNSKKWHDLLVAVQESNVTAVLSGRVPQPLAGVVRNVAFAKQRFDSTAGPVGKMALMLLPAATLLAYIASDGRCEKEQRTRATALLRKMETKFCTAIGVSADWGIIRTWFLRRFDVAYHDIAMSRHCYRHYDIPPRGLGGGSPPVENHNISPRPSLRPGPRPPASPLPHWLRWTPINGRRRIYIYTYIYIYTHSVMYI